MIKELINKNTKLCVQDLYGQKTERIFLRANKIRLDLIDKAISERRLESTQEFFDKLADWFFVKVGYIEGKVEPKKNLIWKGDVNDMPFNPKEF